MKTHRLGIATILSLVAIACGTQLSKPDSRHILDTVEKINSTKKCDGGTSNIKSEDKTRADGKVETTTNFDFNECRKGGITLNGQLKVVAVKLSGGDEVTWKGHLGAVGDVNGDCEIDASHKNVRSGGHHEESHSGFICGNTVQDVLNLRNFAGSAGEEQRQLPSR